MKWLNIIGLVLQFVSFWLAAPELLGAETLKRFESGLIKTISRLPSIVLGSVGIIVGIVMGVYGTMKGIAASEENESSVIQSMMIILAISVLYILYVVFFYKKVHRFIETIFAKPLIYKLITSSESRKVSLILGATLFTIGFLCQLIVLLVS